MKTQIYPTADLFGNVAPTARTPRCWIAVASGDHVRRGVEDSIIQVCHGKAGPLRRMTPGDRVAYYSPSTVMRGTDKLQAFTAYGRVRDGAPYPFDVGDASVRIAATSPGSARG